MQKFGAFAVGGALLVLLGSAAPAQPAEAPPRDQAAASETSNPSAVSPDVNLTPRRVIFGPNDRGVKEITVFNRTNATATYNIVLVDRAMTPEGALVNVDEAPADEKSRLKSATDWIRYSPRQMTLGPQEAQTVRLQARRPADAPTGEYRTHFSVTAVPPQDTGVDINQAAGGPADSKELKIKITPIYGIMIPIIVRTAELPAQASIDDARLVERGGSKALQFTVHRTGDRSLYGGFEAFVPGSKDPIAQIKGVGVYPEIDQRKITLPIDAKAAVTHGSKVRIVYSDDELKPGTVLAETEVTLP